LAGFKDLSFEEVMEVVGGNMGLLVKLMEEGRIGRVEAEILRACYGASSGDEAARERLRELAEKYLDPGGYEQLVRFVESRSRVSWMVFARNYEVKGGYVEEGEEAAWSLEEHRSKLEIVKVSYVEYVDRVARRKEEE